ncbi:phosphoribosylamine-glycine ligase [Fusarium flagelliforme]|uniref:phosphoribosylamine--glycine ligase n=1 Tax=Fusarium flagelliforme TaxID=2675880 RepID=A0A395M6H1_9HYPO|nr:phosphoribosylamine-glycine ligase [Fusarium flagelliforme]
MSSSQTDKIRVLVIGSGGREHAIAWSLSKSTKVDQVICAPGNGGTAHKSDKITNCDPKIDVADFEGLLEVARLHQVNLVIPCSDMSLILGAVDFFRAHNFRVFGPSKESANIEGSKAWAKSFMDRHKIPTAKYQSFSTASAAICYLQSQPEGKYVVKASGPAAGKGVFLSETKSEAEDAVRSIMVERAFGDAGKEVVIEEYLVGRELSVTFITDGSTWKLFPVGQDAQRIYDGSSGPNTGGHKFVGFICTGVMQTENGPKLLEYNARFGDPEAQAIFPLLDDTSDLANIMMACTKGELKDVHLGFLDKAAISLVLSSSGYPGSYDVGEPIHIGHLPEDTIIFHSGTSWVDNCLVTNGGRVLAIACVAHTTEEAIEKAYSGVLQVSFKGKFYRRDIGQIRSSF